VLARHASYADLPEVMREEGLTAADGVLLDLGVCSVHVDESARGFSFLRDGPLQMLYDPEQGVPASRLVNTLSEAELERLFREWGQERHSRAIARAVVARRRQKPFRTTTELAAIMAATMPARERRGRIHPATRCFQALRLAANDELGHLRRGLEHIPFCLSTGARLAVLCYESLEDQEVKRAFRKFSGRCVCPPATPVCRCGAGRLLRVLTQKPLRPSAAEVAANPRARSARLRVAERGESQ